ncbi:peptidase S8 [Bacillus clarus]|uniref:Intracellular serine protease n=1 Tax=Bacillus clarus TaxID=2338372 RepID=A0A090YLH0_9BACI|nr:S8 family peptidase [Bacillus clarus]KFM99653.1 intracellular serine protease [Bacillus clarus]RFT66222.1 peptidase S8 [Bacillus clarus]
MGENIVVAIIDSGCEVEHPDLRERIIGGYNFTLDDDGIKNVYQDYLGHGTHIAGIVGASNKNIGIMGVAPLSKLLILKVINQQGRAKYGDLVKAIRFAKDWIGPDGETVGVINISLGGKRHDIELHQSIIETFQKGILIVASAGKYGDGDGKTDEILYPAFYDEVIQVGAVSRDMLVMDTSNSNSKIDFVAPGELILSTYKHNTHVKLSGTSMAAPHVTGAIALLLKLFQSTEKELISSEVYEYLSKHAKILGNSPSLEGKGLIQLV